MTLAVMLSTDREAVICDMAETYGVFDYKTLPVPLLATLACGLRDNSRIKMRIASELSRANSRGDRESNSFDTVEEFEAARERILNS